MKDVLYYLFCLLYSFTFYYYAYNYIKQYKLDLKPLIAEIVAALFICSCTVAIFTDSNYLIRTVYSIK